MQLRTPLVCSAGCTSLQCSKPAQECHQRLQKVVLEPFTDLVYAGCTGMGHTRRHDILGFEISTVFFWVSVAVISALLPSMKACAISDSSMVRTVHSTK